MISMGTHISDRSPTLCSAPLVSRQTNHDPQLCRTDVDFECSLGSRDSVIVDVAHGVVQSKYSGIVQDYGLVSGDGGTPQGTRGV